jgi:hypothetical protein
VSKVSWKNYLRVGIVLVVTGIIVLAHYALVSNGRLSPGVDLIIGIVLVVAGLPLVAIGMAKVSRR